MTNLRAPEEATLRVQGVPTAEKLWEVQCLNCEAPLHGPFCSTCGQRAVPPHPSVRELIGDAFAEFSGWDGKFADTIRTLLRRPGELTRQWLGGRRVHFIAPLRLYLTASLVYFVVQAATPTAPKKITFSPSSGPQVDLKTSNPEVAAAAAQRALQTGRPLTQAEMDSATAAFAKAPGILKPILMRFATDPVGVMTSMRHMAPRVLFVLLPFYAGILALFYRRRHYPEHLYFAIHLHSFVFIALTVVGLVKLTRIPVVPGIVGLASLVWIPVYSLLALKRVYGGSMGMTLLKGIGIMALYLLLALPALLITVAIAALT